MGRINIFLHTNLRRNSMIRVGIDVSKEKNTVCFMIAYGELLHKPFEVLLKGK